MEDLNKYYSKVDEAITLVGIDPELCRGKEDGQWNLMSEDLEVWIDVMYVEESESTYFQVMAPVCQLPSSMLAEFCQEVLEINYQLVDAAFVVFNDGAYLKVMRDAKNLSTDDMFTALNRIGFYGSYYSKELMTKYKAEKIEHEEDHQ